MIIIKFISGEGRIEPVKVDLKNDRGGLGWKEMINEKKKKKEEEQLKRMEKKKCLDFEEYR